MIKWFVPFVTLLFAACGTKRIAADGGATVSKTEEKGGENATELQKLTFVQKVSDNQVYAKNITGSMSFNIKSGDKDISVPGALRMRKDEVIRIQLFIPLLGSEVGRVEFTPEYVLVIDRIHKEYIKADYTQLDFLKKNGLDFYSLQALFWNQLIMPGARKAAEADLKKYDVSFKTSPNRLVTLIRDNIAYRWMADGNSGRINETEIVYTDSRKEESTLNWKYGNFKNVGVKSFPALQTFTMSSPAVKNNRRLQVTIDMSEVNTNANWEAQSTVSDKYKKVEAQDVFSKILDM